MVQRFLPRDHARYLVRAPLPNQISVTMVQPNKVMIFSWQVCVADIQKQKGIKFVEEQQKIFGSENVIFSLCDVREESEYTSESIRFIFKNTFSVSLITDVLGLPLKVVVHELSYFLFGGPWKSKVWGHQSIGNE